MGWRDIPIVGVRLPLGAAVSFLWGMKEDGVEDHMWILR